MLPRLCTRASRTPNASQGFFSLPPAVRRNFWSTATNAAKADTPEIYDVVCVGGGPAGLSLLSALRSSPSTSSLKIALVDSLDLSPKASPAGTYSNRCSSLTPGSVKFLRSIGAWEHIDAQRTQKYHGMQVWDGVSGSRVEFDPSDTGPVLLDAIPGFNGRGRGDGAVATMTENANLTSALLSHLSGLPSVSTFSKTRVESIELGPEPTDESGLDLSGWPIVSLHDRKLAARLLVGADGANSPVRTFSGIASKGWDYNRHGVVATLKLDNRFSNEDRRTAYQRFLPTGPVALLPLPGDFASLVWSTTPENAARLKSLSEEDFVAMANAAFRLLPVDLAYLHTVSSGQAEEVSWREQNTSFPTTGLPDRAASVQGGSIASFPLRMRHADTYTGERVALLGDAAHTIHPLAGQGLNLGLSDAQSLSKHILSGVEHGMDIGSCWCLDGYNEGQWAKNNAMLGTVDKLHKLYSAGSGPVVWARSLGLDLVNSLGPLKGVLMKQAAGS